MALRTESGRTEAAHLSIGGEADRAERAMTRLDPAQSKPPAGAPIQARSRAPESIRGNRLMNVIDQAPQRVWRSSRRGESSVPSHQVAVARRSSKGGTMFADMRAAYDALPKTMKDRLSTLVGLHGRSTGPAGEKLYGHDKGETEKVYHEMQRPAVIEHPVTGRPILVGNPIDKA